MCLALLGLAGCSTVSDHIGSGHVQLKVGGKYALQKDAIILANRGYINSIENPDRNIQDYTPHKDYDPYYTMPLGVLPGGTVIEVNEIRFCDEEIWPAEHADRRGFFPCRLCGRRLESGCEGPIQDVTAGR